MFQWTLHKVIRLIPSAYYGIVVHLGVSYNRCTLPFSTLTSDAGIKAVPSRLSAVIASKPTVDVVPSISPPYIPSTLNSERMYGTTSSGTESRSKSLGQTIVKHRV